MTNVCTNTFHKKKGNRPDGTALLIAKTQGLLSWSSLDGANELSACREHGECFTLSGCLCGGGGVDIMARSAGSEVTR